MSELHLCWGITRRELRDQVRDWRILTPILMLATVFPFVVNLGVQQLMGMLGEGANALIDRMRLTPFLMMIVGFFPISMSLVIALESFVGEKERSTIEPLLNTPLKDWQIYLGKLLSATLLPLLASYLAMTVYLLALAWNHATIPSFGAVVQLFALGTVQSILMVSAAVAVSAQVTTVRAANLLASFIILPVAMLIPGESVTIFWGEPWVLWVAIFGLLVLAGLFVRVGLAHFQREELLGREFDVLNLRWAARVFVGAFTGGARNLAEWYRLSVLPALRGMGLPAALVSGLVAIAVGLGALETRFYTIPLHVVGYDDMPARLEQVAATWRLFDLAPVAQVWWQNVRALLIGAAAGMFSFGILGAIPILMTTGLAGYFAALIGRSGLPVGMFLVGFVLPHGILEIPAAVISTAAVLKAGALLATPTREKTLGEVWLVSIAMVAKVMLGVVIPLLLAAAIIEVWATPRLALWLFR